MPDSRTTKVFLVSFLAVLCVQFAVAYYWTEPYPAVIEPGFLGAPPTSGRTTIRGYRVVASGPSDSALTMDADAFFTGMPHWYLLSDLPFLLDSTPPAVSGGLHVRGRLFRHSKLRSDGGVPEFGPYAEHRLSELTGHADWDSLRIEETLRTVDVDDLAYVGAPRVLRSREFHLR